MLHQMRCLGGCVYLQVLLALRVNLSRLNALRSPQYGRTRCLEGRISRGPFFGSLVVLPIRTCRVYKGRTR